MRIDIFQSGTRKNKDLTKVGDAGLGVAITNGGGEWNGKLSIFGTEMDMNLAAGTGEKDLNIQQAVG